MPFCKSGVAFLLLIFEQMKRISFLLLFLISFCIRSQSVLDNKSVLAQYQDTLHKLQPKMFKATNSDADKMAANNEFIITLERALKDEKSFQFPFDSLKGIGVLTSEDKKLRIYNWNIQKQDGTHEYFGFMQYNHPKLKKTILYKLNDKSSEIKNPDNSILDNNKWFGCLYYKIIVKKVKKNVYYYLLGWDGNDKASQKKIIDVAQFDNKGSVKFGADVFNYGKKFPKRIIFEFTQEATMSVKYDDRNDMIIFEHLSPRNSVLKGQYQFYGPDGSFDAFEYEKGNWTLIEDVDARNPKSYKDRQYKAPEKLPNPVMPEK